MTRSRLLLLGGGALLLLALAMLVVYGWQIPQRWSTTIFAGADTASGTVILPPFPPLSRVRPFDIQTRHFGTHLYLLGSDPGGRDLLALIARGTVPSALLVLAVVAGRVLLGTAAGLLSSLGPPGVRLVTRAVAGWFTGFPYLALAIVLILAIGTPVSAGILQPSPAAPASRWIAFIVGMTAVGWRDVSAVVSERVEHVLAQPFALGARTVGTSGFMFFRLHVLPYLRPALTLELPFQASAVLVLLAELGFLQVFLGGGITLVDTGRGNSSVASNVLVSQPELGQLLADARRYVLYNQLWLALAPSIAIAVAALAFELIGSGLRRRADER